MQVFFYLSYRFFQHFLLNHSGFPKAWISCLVLLTEVYQLAACSEPYALVGAHVFQELPEHGETSRASGGLGIQLQVIAEAMIVMACELVLPIGKYVAVVCHTSLSEGECGTVVEGKIRQVKIRPLLGNLQDFVALFIGLHEIRPVVVIQVAGIGHAIFSGDIQRLQHQIADGSPKTGRLLSTGVLDGFHSLTDALPLLLCV